jgi:hypothetical protein
MQEHLYSHREPMASFIHFPTACTLSLILNHDLSFPQLLAILDNLVEVSDLTDEERLWVYDKFASRTGKGATRKEADAPFIHFVSVCLATKGSCSSENQNALDASWVDEAIFNQRLGLEVDRILSQSWKALRRVVTAHVQLANSKSWVRACKAEYRWIPTWYSFQNVYHRLPPLLRS